MRREPEMTKKRLIGTVAIWIVTILLALVCLRSGLMKMTPGMGGEQFWIRDFARWGYPDWFRIVVGIAELVSFLLLLVPRVAAVGAGIFAAVMLGAIFTHATHNEFSRLPFNLVLLVFSAIVIYVRRPAFLKDRHTVS